MDNPTILESINEELAKQYVLLKKAADIIKAKNASQYPIFVFYQDTAQLGVLLYEKALIGSSWTINLSFLEEFQAKNLIKKENIAAFKTTYDQSPETICVFLMDANSPSFIFYPQE